MPSNVIKTTDSGVTPRAIDFASRFTLYFIALFELLGITRSIEKQSGTMLKQVVATITLEDGSSAAIGEGQPIPYSQGKLIEKNSEPIEFVKHRKGVTLEEIDKNGYEVAVTKTDNAFLVECIREVMDKFYKFLNSGTLYVEEVGDWQNALAMAKGYVVDRMDSADLSHSEVVGFANELDYAKYLGTAKIDSQTLEGIQYVKDFLGYKTLFLLPNKCIKRGRVIATCVENINNYHINPANGDFAKAGLPFAADSELPLIGVRTVPNDETMVSDMYVLYGISLFAEIIDAIAVVEIKPEGTSLGSLTVTSTEGATDGTTSLAVAEEKINAGTVYRISSSSVTYGAEVEGSVVDITKDVAGLTDGSAYYLVECDAAGHALAAGQFTADVKGATP